MFAKATGTAKTINSLIIDFRDSNGYNCPSSLGSRP